MSKKRTNPGQRTFDALHPARPVPEGYYSGDKPNPNLRSFVEQKSTPYDPENDDYDIRAFNRPIETTKATAIYNMHVYWSKKPHQAIRQYIRHYTKPGDIVLDPFCGSGGTAVSALLKVREIESKEIPHWYPHYKMMNVEDDSIPWGAEWREGRNFRTVAELFTKRNLWALSAIRDAITEVEDAPVREALMFALSGIMLNTTKMCQDRGKPGFNKGTYYIPQVSVN